MWFRQRLESGTVNCLVTIDYPDAITGGLRRTTDAGQAATDELAAD